MAYVGATSGLADIFVLPVLLHLKILRAQIDVQVGEKSLKECNSDNKGSLDVRYTERQRMLLREYRR